MSASATPSSVFRRTSSLQDRRTASQHSSAILVNAPKCNERQDGSSEGVVAIEPVRCQVVDLSDNTTGRPGASKNPFVRFFESFGADATRKNKEEELKELEERRTTVKIVSPVNQRETVGGFDICREYSYSGDEDDNNYFNDSGPVSRTSIAALNLGGDELDDRVVRTHILGKTYDPIRDYAVRRDDESSLFWFTYRCDFPEIVPYNITSDAGWGCMLRSAQMLLGQALRLHFKSRNWKPAQLLSRRRQDPFVRSVLTWFADFPSSTEHVYSLHNMVAAGLAKYDKLPGEWYGPGTACYVLRDLVEMHERQQKGAVNPPERKIFRVYVAPQGSVFRDAIEELMTRDSRELAENDKKETEERQPQHPLESWDEELVEKTESVEWDTALLILIPLRLGLKVFNKEYTRIISHTFSFPQSVGVLGGRPRGARWFYGALSTGDRVFALDPHTVQSAPRKRGAKVNGRATAIVSLDDDYLRSVHTTYPEVFSLLKMDPSIALGFYCKNRAELDAVFERLQRWKEENPSSPELFTVSDKTPDYSCGNTSSAAMDDMMLSNDVGGSLLDDEHDGESDEDEYVML